MGYCMTQMETNFFMPAENKKAAMKNVKEKLATANAHFKWIDDGWENLPTLEKVLEAWGWEAKVDEDGNIVGLSFQWEKRGDELRLFGCLAPFVTNNSSIRMRGDDGEQWKWIFDNGEIHELPGKITFDR